MTMTKKLFITLILGIFLIGFISAVEVSYCCEKTTDGVCEQNNGVWAEGAGCEIAQCSLGCCLIGDQASFVTQTRCKRLASVYGLEIDFRTDLGNEISCIASA